MNTDQFRAVLAAILVVLVLGGLYAGWHVTHPAHRTCSTSVVYAGC